MDSGTILMAAVGGLWTLVVLLALLTLKRMERTLEKLFDLHDKHDDKIGDHNNRLTRLEVRCNDRHPDKNTVHQVV